MGALYKKRRSIETKEYLYPGVELELFAYAINWKSYFKKHLIPYVQGRVLEVGAGIGETSKFLQNTKVSHWTYLEPDRRLFADLVKKNCGLKSNEFICGTTEDINEKIFDTILYIDVLEHIEDDLNELECCSRLLAKGGRIIILSPAHNILFSQLMLLKTYRQQYLIKRSLYFFGSITLRSSAEKFCGLHTFILKILIALSCLFERL